MWKTTTSQYRQWLPTTKGYVDMCCIESIQVRSRLTSSGDNQIYDIVAYPIDSSAGFYTLKEGFKTEAEALAVIDVIMKSLEKFTS